MVYSPNGVPPSITSSPTNATEQAGASATFSVEATGTSPLAYQWYFSGKPIPGATNADYAIASVQASNVGSYSVVVANLWRGDGDGHF